MKITTGKLERIIMAHIKPNSEKSSISSAKKLLQEFSSSENEISEILSLTQIGGMENEINISTEKVKLISNPKEKIKHDGLYLEDALVKSFLKRKLNKSKKKLNNLKNKIYTLDNSLEESINKDLKNGKDVVFRVAGKEYRLEE